MRAKSWRRCSVLACLVCGLISGCSSPQTKTNRHWNPKTAAAYLDQREDWWMTWQGSARDHGTFCISCHTALPYALSRATLDHVLASDAPAPEERKLLDDVTRRVRDWDEIGTYYTDKQDGRCKTSESRGTESVVNALVLASHDAPQGRLSDDTKAALRDMWALQLTAGDDKGSWAWLQFGLRPWESRDSSYYGAALAALATGIAPENYRSFPQIQDNVKQLEDYLNREYETQSLANKLLVLRASTRLPGLLSPEQQKSLIDEVLGDQRSDGGWSLASLNRTWKGATMRSYVRSWIRSDGTLIPEQSDGYATGLAVFVLHQAGVPRDHSQMQAGLTWLVDHQDPASGQWPGYSLNERRNPTSNIGRFMSDAATAYAVLALAQTTAQ